MRRAIARRAATPHHPATTPAPATPTPETRRRHRADRPEPDRAGCGVSAEGPRVRVAGEQDLDGDTPQTPGLLRQVAFDSRNPDASVLSAFRSLVRPGAATGVHHHGDQETVLYVISGIARYRWGDRLEHVVTAGPGDFVFIPARIAHQEINASDDEETVWAVVRSGVDPVVVNLPELDQWAEAPRTDYTEHP